MKMKNSAFSLLLLTVFLFAAAKLSAQIIKDPSPSGKCPSEVNLIQNGNFMYGNDGSFQSALPMKCNSCTAGSYCVGNQLKSKCSAWSATELDHTLGTVSGSFLIVDGDPGKPAVVWSDSVCVCLGQTYTFSFWVKSIYPASQQTFELELLINGTSQKVVSISQPKPTWTKYEVNWTSSVAECIPIAIKQVTGGAYRDFGLDDIYFGFCCECKSPVSVPHCGKFAMALFNGVSPNQFTKIRITPNTGSKVINASIGEYDEDGDTDWKQTIGANYSFVEWAYVGSPIPFDNAGYLDEETYIWMDPAITTNQSVRIDWYDNSTTPNIVATQNISLPMSGDPANLYSDQYDWESNTSILAGANLNVFAGAAPETCDQDRLDAYGDCLNDINYSISCVNNKLVLTFSCNALAPGESTLDWNYSINNSLANLATSNMQLTQSGTYTLYLTVHHYPVYDDKGNDITPADCEYDKTFNVAIPGPVISDADITPYTPNGQCNFLVELSAQQSSYVTGLPASAYSWQITQTSGGTENHGPLSGISISEVFVNPGTYSVKLTITDAYGCTYTATKTFTLSLVCTPKFTWGTYIWCKEANSVPPPANITITFTNKSQGGKCPVTYEMNFSDEAATLWHSFQTGTKTMTHIFNAVPGSGANYTVKIRMKDSPTGGNCSTGKEYSEVIRIEPYFVDFSVLSCPDGKVFFSTANDNPIWTFPGSTNQAGWILQAAFGYFGWYHNSSPEIYYDPAYNSSTGTHSQYYAATLTATNNVTHAQCTKQKEFLVEKLCCDKKVKGHRKYYSTIGNSKYRLWVWCKWKVPGRDINIYNTKIKVTSRVAKAIRKKKGDWFRRAIVDEIYAGIEGKYWVKDSNGVCECVEPVVQGDSRNTCNTSNFPFLRRGKCVYRPKIKQTRNIREQSMEYKAGIIVNGTAWNLTDYFRICN